MYSSTSRNLFSAVERVVSAQKPDDQLGIADLEFAHKVLSVGETANQRLLAGWCALKIATIGSGDSVNRWLDVARSAFIKAQDSKETFLQGRVALSSIYTVLGAVRNPEKAIDINPYSLRLRRALSDVQERLLPTNSILGLQLCIDMIPTEAHQGPFRVDPGKVPFLVAPWMASSVQDIVVGYGNPFTPASYEGGSTPSRTRRV